MTLPFVSAADLRASTPLEPDWLLDGYLAAGALTLLAGKPKVGKSTLAVAIAGAIAASAPSFLGRELRGAPVVYVSEEGPGSLAHKMPASNAIRVLTRDAAWPPPAWHELVAGSIAEAQRVGAGVLVVDTLAHWAGLRPDAEKDAGAAQAAMQPLLDAAHAGLAVLVPLHARKGGGEDGDGVRGSSAITGCADVVLELERTQRPSERALLALSRYPGTPGSLIVEHDPATGSWTQIGQGERSEVRAIADRQAILAALAHDVELTRLELEDATGTPQRQWHTQLDALIREGKVQRNGAGIKGSPYRFKLVRDDSAQPPAQQRAETLTAAASFSAAHPVGVQHQEASHATKPETAHHAETHGWTDDELQALIDADQKAVSA